MTSATPIILERDNVNDESVILVRWFARHGDKVAKNMLLAEVETSKANLDVFSPEDGFLIWDFPEGADLPVSAPLGHISPVAPDSAPRFSSHSVASSVSIPEVSLSTVEAESSPSTTVPEFPTSSGYHQRFSQEAAKMMEKHALTPAEFAGKSLVRKQDVLDVLKRSSAFPRSMAPQEQRTAIAQPYTEIVLSRMKRREGRSLAAGVGNTIQSAVSVECPTRGLRRALDAGSADGNASAVIIYEVSRLLRKYPMLNATYRDGIMLQYEQVNLGFAMDDGRGLKVAVFQDCDTLSLQQVSAELRNLTLAYVEDKLAPVQIANATFTISDISVLGVSSFYPLISENQCGILGIGGEQFLPGSEYGFYTLTLSFDHQLCDGRTAALYLNDLKGRLQGYEAALESAREEIACSECGRTTSELAALNRYLLRSASPQGYLCTLCAAGY
jgi:pyruvate/2-oxoglutarate dehydrogenase complex dihydrolipoamide acyltransferase (E2) component